MPSHRLSNTATPKYYGQFKEAVIQGRIPVCKTIDMEMNRIDSLIENPGIWYDQEAVEGFIAFCENELTLTDGSDMHLLDTFKLWAEEVFGWYYFIEKSVWEPNPDGVGGKYMLKRIKKRLINEQYLIIPRGGAKSMYDEAIQAYFLTVDTSTTQQITTAPTMKQAEEVTNPLITAIRRVRGPLFRFLTNGTSIHNTKGLESMQVKLASTKKGIENKLTNSILEIRPMSVDSLQGLRQKIATVDEWLSCDIRENVIDALKQGGSKLDDYLIIASSSEGTVRNGVGDDIKMMLMDILKGEYIDPHVSIFWYQLDSIEEIKYPELWVKAQPNIGKTVQYEVYHQEVEKAEKVPSSRNDILAKRFGIPMEGFTYFFTYEEIIPHKHRDFWSLPCALGLDLSRGDDFCSACFLFPLSTHEFGIKTRNYITSLTLMKLPPALRQEYEKFINEGSLIVMDGTILNMMDVYDELDRYIDDSKYDVISVGYDPYNAKEFIDRWEKEHGPFGIEKVIQGSKTESVPLGELKKLAEERMLLFDQEIMHFAMGNSVVMTDTNGNRKLFKKRADQKIDPVAAMMDAFISYKINLEAY